jgi:hypothetical protein
VRTWHGSSTFDYDQFGRLESKSLEGSAKAPIPQLASELSYGSTLWNPSYGKVVQSTQHNRFAGSTPNDVLVRHAYSYGGPGARVDARDTSISGIGLGDDHFHIGYECSRLRQTA